MDTVGRGKHKPKEEDRASCTRESGASVRGKVEPAALSLAEVPQQQGHAGAFRK